VSAGLHYGEHLGLREVLLSKTRLTLEQLEEAARRQREAGGRLVDRILELRYLDEDEVLKALAEQLGLPLRETLSADDVDPEVASRVPIGFAKAHGILPIGTTARGSVRVARRRSFPGARSWRRSTRSTIEESAPSTPSSSMPPTTLRPWPARSAPSPRTCWTPTTTPPSSAWWTRCCSGP
jgi:hypothetical protein